MSYDINLIDRDTGKTIHLPFKHTMIGGTYEADYDESTGQVIPKPISEAWLNITYNYSSYYYEATEGDPRFAHDEVSAYYADGTEGEMKTEYGIRGIYGKTGHESIEMLNDMIRRIKDKYKKDGEWITTEREEVKYFLNNTGEEIEFYDIIRNEYAENQYHSEVCKVHVYEGDDSDYWKETAVNALKPLYKLLTMAKLRPDGIWDGD